MADRSAIEWVKGEDGTAGATWNPITGCSVVSAGCKHCYAMKLAGTRLAHTGSRQGLTRPSAAGPVWNGKVRFNQEWLDQPLRWRRPRRIFVCAHGDLFHESVPDAWIDQVMAVIAEAHWHTFIVLTKRADRMEQYLRGDAQRRVDAAICALARRGKAPAQGWGGEWPLPNLWLGISAEDQESANARIPALLRSPAAVRWISAEPLIGAIDLQEACQLHRWTCDDGIACCGMARMLDWVVVGGESGVNARAMNPRWAMSLRDQCNSSRIAFFFKQWGSHCGGIREGDFATLFNGESMLMGWDTTEWGGGYVSQRMAKSRAGRHLEGRMYDEAPAARIATGHGKRVEV